MNERAVKFNMQQTRPGQELDNPSFHFKNGQSSGPVLALQALATEVLC